MPTIVRVTAPQVKGKIQFGAPSLSLRAIARELGITAPAIYNYFPRRDDLVTALIIDAYNSFGDSQLAARDAVQINDPVARLKATGLAYRMWALTYPQRYELIFGTPIPGYTAPFEQVFPSAARSLGALVSVMETYQVDPDKYECVYGNMPKFGLGAALNHVPAVGNRETARLRLGANKTG